MANTSDVARGSILHRMRQRGLAASATLGLAALSMTVAVGSPPVATTAKASPALVQTSLLRPTAPAESALVVTPGGEALTVSASLAAPPLPPEGFQPAPEAPPLPAPTIEAVIDISDQRMTVFVDGVQEGHWKVSTGARGHTTPPGVFTPFFLSRYHRSSIYNNAPMPYSVFFNGNIAVHGTNQIRRLGRPASHGCVRLHPQNAKTFFNLVLDRGRDAVSITVQH